MEFCECGTELVGDPLNEQCEDCIDWLERRERAGTGEALALAEGRLPEEEVVYLAAPLSHPEERIVELRAAAVKAYAKRLITEGRIVFCPVVYSWEMQQAGRDGMPAAEPVGSWYEFDLHFLRKADAVVVLELPGWAESVGVQLELARAAEWGLPVRMSGPWLDALQGWFDRGWEGIADLVEAWGRDSAEAGE